MHILIDCETVPAESCAKDEGLALIQRRKLEQKYKKPETIESHMADFVRSMSLEPGTAQVCCIVAQVYDTKSTFARVTDNELGLLQDFRDWLNSLGDEMPTLVGWNIRKFDLPVIAAAYLRNGYTVPSQIKRAMFNTYQQTIDYYAIFGTGLQKFAHAIGNAPLAVSGADVAELYAEGNLEAILRHCQDDVEQLERIHWRVHG